MLDISCSTKINGHNYTPEIIDEKIKKLSIGDTLDLNITNLLFYKIIILSHEIDFVNLKQDVQLSDLSTWDQAKLKYNNWGILWVKESSIVDMIEFSPANLMFENLVGKSGYAIINKRDLKKMLIIKTDKKFVNSEADVLDVKLID